MTDTDRRLDRIEELVLTLAGRMDMVTIQIAQLATNLDALTLQVGRLVAGMVAGFTRRDELFRATDDRLATIDRKLDELDRLVSPPAP
jgi:hypothetical protein